MLPEVQGGVQRLTRAATRWHPEGASALPRPSEHRLLTSSHAALRQLVFDSSMPAVARQFGIASARNKSGFDPARSEFLRRLTMFVLLSVLVGLFLLGFGISRLKAQRAAKPDVQMLFGRK